MKEKVDWNLGSEKREGSKGSKGPKWSRGSGVRLGSIRLVGAEGDSEEPAADDADEGRGEP